ncbi:MAG: hypothetical protein MZW92_10340 [Comamonadaceae bacterium]|nr:hypothetical protein [Comamonadaceae bacterium]
MLRGALRKPEEIAQQFGLDVEEVRRIAKVFKIQITPYYAGLIKERGDAMWRQMVPDPAELRADTGVADPLEEDHDSPVPSIVHRYPDRCLFLVSHSCASYCRFCTRKRKVGDPSKIHPRYIEDGLAYIRAPRGDPGRRHLGRRPAHARRPPARGHRQGRPGHPPRRDHPHRHARALRPAAAGHREARGHAQEVPSALRQRPLQPPRRAHAGVDAGPGPAGRRRHPARQPDGAAQGRQRRPAGHAPAHAEAPGGAGPALLHLPGRLRVGDRAPADDGREGARDHGEPAGLDLGAGRALLLHRRARGRRQDPGPAEVPAVDQRGAGRAAELRRGAVRLPAGQDQAEAQAAPGRRPLLQLRRRPPHALKTGHLVFTKAFSPWNCEDLALRISSPA